MKRAEFKGLYYGLFFADWVIIFRIFHNAAAPQPRKAPFVLVLVLVLLAFEDEDEDEGD